MNFIDIPTEQTTALTDFILGLVIIGGFLSLSHVQDRTSATKLSIWLRVLGFLGFASIVGAAAHGLAMSKELNFWLWQPINLALGLVIAMFAAATIYEVWGGAAYQRTQWPLIGVAVLFYAITLLIPGTFLTFIVYEAFAMLFALGGYLYLAIRKQPAGAWWLVAGILITILAAIIQAVGKTGVALFWGLDHNGVFHLIQLFGVLAILIGLHKLFHLQTAAVRIYHST